MPTNAQGTPSFEEIVRLNEKLDQQLKDFSRGSDSSNHPRKFSWKRFLIKLLLLVGSLVIPFIVLVHTSVYVYHAYHLNGWLALSVGVLATIFLLMGYAAFLTYRLGKGIRMHKYLVRGIIGLVTAYTLYGVFYYSSLNTKTDEIRSYYRSLHPIIRVALTTITLADSDLLVTDIRREAEDYSGMGLPEYQESLHYLRSDGYVHAVDLRTIGRSEWKNWLTSAAFSLVGLQTIRHVGTADHLHVYLPLNE